MALTKCNVPGDVIGSLATRAEERGLTPQEFKDKFDEMPEGIKQYINEVLTEEIDAHIADYLVHKEEIDAHIADYLVHKEEIDAHIADYLVHKAEMATLRYSTESTEYGNIFSVNPATVQGAMKGKLKGATHQNLVKNGNFAGGTTGWIPSSVSGFQVIDGVAEFTGTAQHAIVQQDISKRPSHKMFFFATILSDSSEVVLYLNDGVGQHGVAHSGSGNFERISGIFTTHAMSTTTTVKVQDNRVSGWTKIKVYGVGIIDLTAEGLTNLTEDQLNQKFSHYIDGMQSVQPQEILSRGKNLWGGKLELGVIYPSGDAPSTIDIRTREFTQVKPNTTYRLSYSGMGANDRVYMYNAQKQYLSDIVSSAAFTTPANCAYVRFRILDTTDTNKQIQLEEGTTATTYEPYQESKAYLKYPLRSVPNGVADEVDLQSGKLTKRCGELVLQANYITDVENGVNYDGYVFAKSADFKSYGNSEMSLEAARMHLVSGFSPTDLANLSLYGLLNRGNGTQLMLIVPKGTYANLAAAQAAFAGTKIVYQLAEPEVVEDALSNQLTVYPSGAVYTQPYEAELEESTIPIIEHSEPINLAGAVKSESDRNTRQDEQINDIMLLLDYLIVVNA